MKVHEAVDALKSHEGDLEVCDEFGHPVTSIYVSESGYVALEIDMSKLAGGGVVGVAVRAAFLVGFALVQAVAQLAGGRIACRLVGHDPAWWYGVSVLDHDGPGCKRCGARL